MPISKIGSKGIKDAELSAADIAPGTITSDKIAPGTIANDRLAGSIANAKLANSTTTINGTAIALGASGNIVAGTDWQAVKTANYTAVAGQGIFCNTTAGAFTITLPASPSVGDEVHIVDYANTFATNNLTVARNSSPIDGGTSNAVLNIERTSARFVYVDGTKGWRTIFEEVTSAYNAEYVAATGGTVSTSGDYKIHLFNSSSNFVVSAGGNPTGSSRVDYLVLAGGGAGGGKYIAGGGGAGGFRESTPNPAAWTGSPLATSTGITAAAQTYPITVGAGGAGNNQGGATDSTNGSSSTFSTITSAGGGFGKQHQTFPGRPGRGGDGGSGGGANGGGGTSNCSPGNLVKGNGNTPPVSPSQGNPGGNGSGNSPNNGAGGGGGAGGAGGCGASTSGGNGGAGVASSITGSAVTRAGGGGGNSYGGGTPGTGGSGGGTAGVTDGNATAASANTGSGGGGVDSRAGTHTGGNGGSGVVVLRYKYQN